MMGRTVDHKPEQCYTLPKKTSILETTFQPTSDDRHINKLGCYHGLPIMVKADQK